MIRFSPIVRVVSSIAMSALALSFASCGAVARVTSKAATEAEELFVALGKAPLPTKPVVPSELSTLDQLIVDLKAIPEPTAADTAALAKALDMVVYRESMASALALADSTTQQLPAVSGALADDVFVATPTEPFRLHVDAIVEDMVKSTTCELAHELMSANEQAVLDTDDYPIGFNQDANVAGAKAIDFFEGRVEALNYAVLDAEGVFPPLTAFNKIYEVSTGTIDTLQGIAEAENPATTRAYYYYFRPCVVP